MLLFCLSLSDEGVYVDTNGKITKNVVLQWGELPTSVGKLVSHKECSPTIGRITHISQ